MMASLKQCLAQRASIMNMQRNTISHRWRILMGCALLLSSTTKAWRLQSYNWRHRRPANLDVSFRRSSRFSLAVDTSPQDSSSDSSRQAKQQQNNNKPLKNPIQITSASDAVGRVKKKKHLIRNGRRSSSQVRRHRNKNPAMGDTAFLRKRTANLLKLTSPTKTDNCDTTLSRNMKVDRKTFHFLMDAWAFSGEPDAPDQAMRLLERMEELGNNDSNIKPDVRSYTKTMNAIARSARVTAGKEADSLLEKMVFLSATNTDVRPNTFTYTAVLEAYANSGAPGSAQRADELCHVMASKFAKGDQHVRPTARAFNAAITAYAKSGEPDAAQKAQDVFSRLEKLYYESGMMLEEAKPNAFNYNALISAWANNIGQEGSAQRAQQVLERMEFLYKSGDQDVKPTTVSFNAVIDAYAKSGEEGAAEKAEEILRRMESGENVDARPNVRSFNSVINVWAKSGHKDAAIKAQDMLDLMERLYEQGNVAVRPDVHSFCTVINAWARSQKRGKAERALNLLREMIKLYEAGNDHLQPNVVAYNAVMNACAFTNGDVHEQNRAVEISHSILKEMEQSPRVSPDQVTYGTFLKVCANQMPDCSTRQRVVEVLFKKCCRDGQVGNLVLQQLRSMASDELYERLVGQRIDENVKMEDLPKEWWCNVVEGKWRRRRNLG